MYELIVNKYTINNCKSDGGYSGIFLCAYTYYFLNYVLKFKNRVSRRNTNLPIECKTLELLWARRINLKFCTEQFLYTVRKL